MHDTATRRRSNKTQPAKRPHQKKNLKQQNRNTTDKTAHTPPSPLMFKGEHKGV